MHVIHPRAVVYDIETTGFQHWDGDRVIEIGAVELFDGCRIGQEFHAYVNPNGRHSAPDAFKAHGIPDEFLTDKEFFYEVAPRFSAFCGDDPMIAHNGLKFDGPFLAAEYRKAGLEPLRNQQIDTYVMACESKHASKLKSLDALLAHYEIDASSRVKHGALIDSRLLAQVYTSLLGLHMLLSEADLAQPEKILEASAADQASARHVIEGFLPGISADAEEAVRHAAFVAQIKNSIWSRFMSSEAV